jgi:hypothetical protein
MSRRAPTGVPGRSNLPSVMQMRPASFGDNLNEWFRVLGRTWKPLIVVSLLAFAPVAAAVAVLFGFTDAGGLVVDLMDPAFVEDLPPEEVISELTPLIWAGAIWVMLQTVASLFVYVAGSRIVAEDRAGMQPTWRTAGRHASARLFPVVLGALIAFVGFAIVSAAAVGVGWLAIESLGVDFLSVFIAAVVGLTAVVLSIWIGLSIAFYPQLMAMEDAGAAEGLRRSFRLVQGRWWVTAGFVLVTSLIASAVAQVASLVFLPLAFVGVFVPAALSGAYAFAVLLQGPFTAVMATAYAIWYLDLRSRQETVTADQIV